MLLNYKIEYFNQTHTEYSISYTVYREKNWGGLMKRDLEEMIGN